MKFRIVTGLVLATIACLAPVASHSAEADYISLFGGAWSGSGIVLNDDQPVHIGCQMVGTAGINHLTIKGSCGVFLIAVNVAAEVTYDPQAGRYDGTYTSGDLVARISGQRTGDTVDFTMTWTKPINGDISARLTIVNAGKGNLRIVVDDLKIDAPEQRTSDVMLTRR